VGLSAGNACGGLMAQEARGQFDESASDSLFPCSCAVVRDGPQRRIWNVRAVGFISKPERTEELALVIERSVSDLLQELPGFAGAMVLRPQNEKRNLLVLSFWETEEQAAMTRWEINEAVRGVISPMVDVCTRVQTFQATAATRSSMTNRKPVGMFAVACA
jgi:hypothetical protein